MRIVLKFKPYLEIQAGDILLQNPTLEIIGIVVERYSAGLLRCSDLREINEFPVTVAYEGGIFPVLTIDVEPRQ